MSTATDLDPDELRDALPSKVRDLADRVGLDLALDIARKTAGQRIFVPKTGLSNRKGRELVELLGESGAQALQATYGGSVWEAPTLARVERAMRYRAIREEYQSQRALGASAADTYKSLVAKYRMADRSIRKIAGGAR
jgi:hypothetical protein